MTALYIRWPNDDPHAKHEFRPGVARCGAVLIKAAEISEKQALVFLGDRRCPQCFPHQGSKLGVGGTGGH